MPYTSSFDPFPVDKKQKSKIKNRRPKHGASSTSESSNQPSRPDVAPQPAVAGDDTVNDSVDAHSHGDLSDGEDMGNIMQQNSLARHGSNIQDSATYQQQQEGIDKDVDFLNVDFCAIDQRFGSMPLHQRLQIPPHFFALSIHSMDDDDYDDDEEEEEEEEEEEIEKIEDDEHHTASHVDNVDSKIVSSEIQSATNKTLPISSSSPMADEKFTQEFDSLLQVKSDIESLSAQNQLPASEADDFDDWFDNLKK